MDIFFTFPSCAKASSIRASEIFFANLNHTMCLIIAITEK